MYIHGSNVDVCHGNARVIISHAWAYARWQETIECIAIADSSFLTFLIDCPCKPASVILLAMAGYSINHFFLDDPIEVKNLIIVAEPFFGVLAKREND